LQLFPILITIILNLTRPTQMLPTLDIILVNRNSGAALLECLTSVAHAENTAFILRRVCLVDDASTDNSAAPCEELPLPLEILRNPEHAGYGASCNRGAETSTADYILFLNTDCTLFADSIELPIAFMEQVAQARVGIVGIQLLDSDGRTSRSCARFPTLQRMISTALGLDRVFPSLFPSHQMKEWDHLETREVDQVIGAFMLVRRALFERLGGYDERFFVYMEDLDFSLRMRRLGYRSIYLASAKAMHKGGETARKVQAESLFFGMRSRIQYACKHFGPLGGSIVALCVLLLEPFSRLALAAARRSPAQLTAVAEAYGKLWAELLSGRLCRNILSHTLRQESCQRSSARGGLHENTGAKHRRSMEAATEAGICSEPGNRRGNR
jgi:N-acetylglucosaminyl-diphospho-decaprenol L-rhamnosyltransferase